MKIAHVITSLETGGAETALVGLLSHRGEASDSLVVALRTGPQEQPIRRLGVPVHIVPVKCARGGLLGVGRVAAVLRAVKPDVVHGWLCHANLIAHAAVVVSQLRVPVIWGMRHSLHDLSTESAATGRLILGMARASAWPSRIIYNSCRSAVQHEAAGYDRRRTVVIPNGFDCNSFQPSDEARLSVRQELGIEADAKVIGLVARYHRVKDHETFLRAAHYLVRSGLSAQFVLVGRGTDGPALAESVGRFGLRARAHCLGERCDIARLTAAFDVATCASVAESFPNVIGEAMACGIPCVTTDVGDAAMLVGETGLVIAPRDARALASAWRDLLQASPERRRQLGGKARARVLEHFSLPHVVSRYDAVYADVARLNG